MQINRRFCTCAPCAHTKNAMEIIRNVTIMEVKKKKHFVVEYFAQQKKHVNIKLLNLVSQNYLVSHVNVIITIAHAFRLTVYFACKIVIEFCDA